MRSLSRTLSVRFSLTMFVALALIGAGAFLGGRPTLSRLVDRGLAAALGLESAVLAVGLSIAQDPGPDDLAAFVDRINRFVVVRDSAGNVVATNTPLGKDLPLASESFEQALGGERAWASGTWEHGRLRSVYAPTPVGSLPGFDVIQVSASLQPLRRAGQRLLFFVAVTVVLAVGATAVGAGWLARSSVAPVGEITRHAEAIDPATPGKRISAHADTEEFHGLVGVLNSMLERLEGALDSQRRIIADVGHELRTPITALQGQLEVALRAERTPGEYRDVLESCLEETEHLATMNETLLFLARVDAGESQPTPRPVDMRQLVEQAVARARTRDTDREFRVLPREPKAVDAVVDPKLVEIVLDRLLDNTIEHTPSGTHVCATVDREDSDVVVTIEDDGPGLPRDAMSHLFDRFYRVDLARSRAPGAGLGLSVAAAVAEVHHGSIRAEPSDLGGLKLTVSLPTAVSDPEPS